MLRNQKEIDRPNSIEYHSQTSGSLASVSSNTTSKKSAAIGEYMTLKGQSQCSVNSPAPGNNRKSTGVNLPKISESSSGRKMNERGSAV